MRKISFVLMMLALFVASIAPGFAQENATIADIVVDSATGDMPEFATLLAAVQAADPAVLEALSNPDADLTVFAPTDAAFAALVEALGEDAFNAVLADQEALTGILLYHVLEGTVMSSDVVGLLEMSDGWFTAETLNGQYIDVSLEEDGSIYIDDAGLNLEMIDIEASNGVIHVIDAVIVPESRTIAEVVVDMAEAEEPEFSTLLAAVGAADPAVLELLGDEEAALTVFAPTDAAFEALGEETINAVLADPAMLTGILQYHVVADSVYSGDLVDLLTDAEMGEIEVEMADGNTVTIRVDDEGSVFINDAEVVLTDVDAANGVIHVIDAVILPPSA